MRALILLLLLAVSPLWASDSFTAVGNGTTYTLINNPLGFTQTGTYQVSGSFTATLVFQFSMDGQNNWGTIATITAPVGPVVFAGPGYYRLACTAYTSGTAVGAIVMAPRIWQQQYGSAGNLLFQVDDSGVTAAGLGSGAVSSVNGLTGAVTFAAGSNITLTPAGQTITIASSGGGSNPLTTLGDTLYGAGGGTQTRLAGNTTSTKNFYTQTGTGSASAAPAWGTLSAGDIPNLPGTIITSGAVSPQFGGTGLNASTAANGQLLIGTGSGLALATLTAGANTTITNGSGTITIASSGGSGFPVSTTTYAVQDSSDSTKQQLWNLASQTTGTNLTLKGQQSTSQTLAFPNITGSDTVATLGLGNAFTGANTFGTAVTPVSITAGVANAVNPPSHFSFVSAADTNLNVGSAGSPDVIFDLSQTKTWTGTTTVTNYISYLIKHPVLAATASTTFSAPATFEIDGPPTAGTNGTISGGFAMLVNSGNAQFNGTLVCKTATANLAITQANASSGSNTMAIMTGGSHTNLTASTEVVDFDLALNQTKQHATGAIATQRAAVIRAPTYSFVGASTITTADTLAITGAPAAGTNATITTANALHVQGGQTELDGALLAGGATAPAANTFSGNVLWGVTNNTAASAGQVGEVLTATTSTYTNYTTTATYQQVATLSITAGAWDITCYGTVSGNAATLTTTGNAIFALSTTTASATGTTEGAGDIGYISEAGVNATSGKSSIVLHKVINQNATTSWFLNSQASFSAGAPQFVGSITAVRIR